MGTELREALSRVDWFRVGHRLFTGIRILRGDQAIEEDTVQERRRVAAFWNAIDTIGRMAVLCTRRDDCECPIHREERAERDSPK